MIHLTTCRVRVLAGLDLIASYAESSLLRLYTLVSLPTVVWLPQVPLSLSPPHSDSHLELGTSIYNTCRESAKVGKGLLWSCL